MEEKLAETWSEVLGIEKECIGIETDFFRLGGHSLNAAQLTGKIQQRFKIIIPLVQVFKTSTIKSLAKFIISTSNEKEIATMEDENLVLLRKTPGNKHLFLVHDGSGEVDGYVEFCMNLDKGFNYWGLKGPLIESCAPTNITIEELAANYTKKIKKVQKHGPYYIAGWSIGGTIAFEMARQLEENDDETEFLALFDTSAPFGNLRKTISDFTAKSELKLISQHITTNDILSKLKKLHDINQIWSLVIKYLEDNLDIEIIRNFIPGHMAKIIPGFYQLKIQPLIANWNKIRSLQRAAGRYTPAGKNNTNVHFFAAKETDIINRKQWNHYSVKPITLYEVEGDHYSIFKKNTVKKLSTLFNRTLKKTISADNV
ncbi:MAG: hypothetical protein GY757_51730 [bacterium]|nr:hypothetical protein [bacterium]